MVIRSFAVAPPARGEATWHVYRVADVVGGMLPTFTLTANSRAIAEQCCDELNASAVIAASQAPPR